MAKNIRQGSINQSVNRIGCIPTYPTVVLNGGACVFGDIAGVAEGIADPVSLKTTVVLDCIAELVVQGVNGSGNVAVTAGDKLYASKADPVVISKITTGVPVGIALGNALTDGGLDTVTGTLVTSGATTTTIRVLVKPGI